MQRFYKQASVVAVQGGFRVTLDDRPVLTPGRQVVNVPSMALAEAIAQEWAGQGEEVDPESMPLTRIAATALDRAGPQRAAVSQAIIAYAATDLLCYRAESPAELAERQAAVWQPILDWATLQFDAPMMVTAGLLPVAQSPSSLDALAKAVHALDDFQLAALSTATASSGSLIIGLALAHGHLTAPQAFAASQVDETFQAERWGLDEQAEKTRQGLAADLNAAGHFFTLLAG
ncbi:MAG: ATP12 family chaperone protein [Alphaproteobacteria bacterium]